MAFSFIQDFAQTTPFELEKGQVLKYDDKVT
jgi:hypothetical protein